MNLEYCRVVRVSQPQLSFLVTCDLVFLHFIGIVSYLTVKQTAVSELLLDCTMTMTIELMLCFVLCLPVYVCNREI